MTEQEAKEIKQRFAEKYGQTEPYKGCVNNISLTLVLIVYKQRIGRLGRPNRVIWGPELPEAYNPNEYCIKAHLLAALPQGFSFPEEFEGMKVFSEVIGNLEALETSVDVADAQ
jgi:hypothetical protein